MTATGIVLLTVSTMLIVQAVISICYIVKSIRYRRALDDIIHYLDGVEGRLPHDELRITQARNSAERALYELYEGA